MRHDTEHDATAPPAEFRRGRGATSNESGRFESARRVLVDDGWSASTESEAVDDARRALATSVSIDASRTVLTRNASPDVPFDRSVNPYRGCEHGCVYCFARPSHAFLGLSPGLDFETKLMTKPDAPAQLARAFAKRGYRPKPIAIGTNTDPYQPIERRWRIMRGILSVLLEHRHPVTIVTKGARIIEDIDLLAQLAKLRLVRVALSITTLDATLSREMEPRASTPTRRLGLPRAWRDDDAGLRTDLFRKPSDAGSAQLRLDL